MTLQARTMPSNCRSSMGNHSALAALFTTWHQHRLDQVRAILGGNGNRPSPDHIARDLGMSSAAAEYYLEAIHAQNQR